jgi:hypothetical protein
MERTPLPCLTPDIPVVLLKSGPHAGRIAVITEIMDHNRVSLLLVRPEVNSTSRLVQLGNHRRPYNRRSPPSLPVQTHDTHASRAYEAATRRRYGRRQKATGEGGYCYTVGEVILGDEAGCY